MRSTLGIICGPGSFAFWGSFPVWGSFAVRSGSFAVHFGDIDHFRSGDHLQSTVGIICGSGSFAVRDHLRFGNICGPHQGSFAVRSGSFAVHFGDTDHFRSRDHLQSTLGIDLSRTTIMNFGNKTLMYGRSMFCAQKSPIHRLQFPQKYQARGKSYTCNGFCICKTLLCNISWITSYASC